MNKVEEQLRMILNVNLGLPHEKSYIPTQYEYTHTHTHTHTHEMGKEKTSF